MPFPGAGALFFIQIFATLGFAVLYSTLVLYATKRLGFNESSANAMMGVFGAFNYGLHMFGGYLGGRFLSNRNLFVLGMVLQVIGCALIAVAGVWGLYWGLAMFLTGSGLNVTCINMMLTQRFKPDDDRRESAFLWNYAGMNLGFFVGFTVAGYFQLTENYRALFLFATLGNAAAIIVAVCRWRILADLNTPLHDASRSQYRWRMLVGLAVLVALVPIIRVMLTHAEFSGHFVIVLGALIFLMLCVVTLRHHPRDERRRMAAYLIGAGLAGVLGAVPAGTDGADAVLRAQHQPERLRHSGGAAVDPEHQHAGDRGGRPAAGTVVQPPARSRLQHRHSAAVLRIAVLHRLGHAGAAAGYQHGGRQRAGGIQMDRHQLCTAKRR